MSEIPYRFSFLRKAHAAGKQIQMYFADDQGGGTWEDVEPQWAANREYRIKPEEPEWKPTHQHADGGLYRFEKMVTLKTDDDELWVPGVEYTSRQSSIPYVTTQRRWVRRFREL